MSTDIVIVNNELGHKVRAIVYQESPDGSGRLDLLIPKVEGRTVTWYPLSKAALGVDYVLPGQDTSRLGEKERDHFNTPPIEIVETQDSPGLNDPAGIVEPQAEKTREEKKADKQRDKQDRSE